MGINRSSPITPESEKAAEAEIKAARKPKEPPIEFYPEEPKFSFDEIILPQSVKDKILDVADYAENSKRVFEDWGLQAVYKQSRRISTHIEFKLPDLDCRKKLWRHYILPTMPNNIDIDEPAEKYDGISGSDIANAVLMAHEVDLQRNLESNLHCAVR